MRIYWVLIMMFMLMAFVSAASQKFDVSVTVFNPDEGLDNLEVEESLRDAGANAGITGAVVDEGESEPNIGVANFIPIAFIIFILAAKVYATKKKRLVG